MLHLGFSGHLFSSAAQLTNGCFIFWLENDDKSKMLLKLASYEKNVNFADFSVEAHRRSR